MGKKQPTTPSGKIRNSARRLWLTSRERAAALKREKYCCQKCGVKQSKAKGKEQKIEVHHLMGVANWDALIEAHRKYLLVDPSLLIVLCPDCHQKEHEDD